MPRTPCDSRPWICTWCWKWNVVSRQPTHGSYNTRQHLAGHRFGLSYLPERVGGILALKAQQFVSSFLHSWLPPSPAEVAGCLLHIWGGQQHFPPTLEPRSAMQGAAASPPEVAASLALLLGGLEPGNGTPVSCRNRSHPHSHPPGW